MKNVIEIKKDMSYLSELDLLSVEKGVAELGIHSIRFSNLLTEEEKEENSKAAESLSKGNWGKRCDEKRLQVAVKVEKIIDLIHEKFMVYQYKNTEINYSKDNWDLFFWSNSNDMSYVTLNPNEKRSNEQQIEDINKVLSLLETIVIEGIQVHIQYKSIYKDEIVQDIVLNEFGTVKDKFIDYNGITGKIKEVGKSYSGKVVYGFFKKGARSKYYQVSESWFLNQSFRKVKM